AEDRPPQARLVVAGVGGQRPVEEGEGGVAAADAEEHVELGGEEAPARADVPDVPDGLTGLADLADHRPLALDQRERLRRPAEEAEEAGLLEDRAIEARIGLARGREGVEGLVGLAALDVDEAG